MVERPKAPSSSHSLVNSSVLRAPGAHAVLWYRERGEAR